MVWNTGKLLFRRILAFLIDYLLITGYAMFLLVTALLVVRLTGGEMTAPDPVNGQLIGFFTLTLPVFLYFYLMESGKRRATFGKSKMGLVVRIPQQTGVQGPGIFIRNLLKFLPWEVAHTGVHWIVYYSLMEQYPPVWVYVVLILPQLTILLYFLSMVLSGGDSTLYDRAARTRVILQGEG